MCWCSQASVILQQHQKSFRTLLNRPLLARRSSSKRQINEKMITMEVFPDTGEVDEGPLASCRMDGSIQNSALYPLGMEPFPGAKTLSPRDPHCQNVTRTGRGFDQIWKADNSCRWRCLNLWVRYILLLFLQPENHIATFPFIDRVLVRNEHFIKW